MRLDGDGLLEFEILATNVLGGELASQVIHERIAGVAGHGASGVECAGEADDGARGFEERERRLEEEGDGETVLEGRVADEALEKAFASGVRKIGS